MNALLAEHTPKQNHLLAALPLETFSRLSPHLEFVLMQRGEILYESDGWSQYAYFPITAIISLHCSRDNCASILIAGVGNEGMFGVANFNGCDISLHRAVVCARGYAYRLDSGLLMQEFNRAGAVMYLTQRYVQALSAMLNHAELGIRYRQFDGRLWLFSNYGRCTKKLSAVQDCVAIALGMCRENIMEIVGDFQRVGLVCLDRYQCFELSKQSLELHVGRYHKVARKEFCRLYSDSCIVRRISIKHKDDFFETPSTLAYRTLCDLKCQCNYRF